MRTLTLALLSVTLIAGCAARSVRIAELRDRPDKYDDKTVSVTGVVTTSLGTSLIPLPFQLYKVDDGSGEITVLAQSGRRVPQKGARVQVKGRVGEVASIGGNSVGLHIRESDRDVKD